MWPLHVLEHPEIEYIALPCVADITEEIKFTINSIFGRPSDDGTVWELAAMHQQSDICETPCLNNSPG